MTHTAPPATDLTLQEGQYAKIAQAVAALLSQTITAAVDRAVATGITQLRKELGDHAKRLSELEHHISDIEDEIHQSQASDQQYAHTQQYKLEKLDDLENCACQNNLRIIGLPESFTTNML